MYPGSEMMKLGQLYLQLRVTGRGEQIVGDWVQEVSTRNLPSSHLDLWHEMWLSVLNQSISGSYRADGAFGRVTDSPREGIGCFHPMSGAR